MPFHIVRNDITQMHCDAIVNEIHAEDGCNVGKAGVTKGDDLPCRYVIHTAGPIWTGGENCEAALLASCYRSSLNLAREYECNSIAFPLISADAYGYPKDQAFKIALNEIRTFLLDNDMTVYIVIHSNNDHFLGSELSKDINEYIKDHYTGEPRYAHEAFAASAAPLADVLPSPSVAASQPPKRKLFGRRHAAKQLEETANLGEILKHLDESFSEMLLRKIDEKGISDSECYKKANIDRKLFSKIRSNPSYRPSKTTAIAFAIALELDLDETNSMLRKAGYALSHSNKFDVIVEYFIKNHNYDIYEINEALFEFDQMLLGS